MANVFVQINALDSVTSASPSSTPGLAGGSPITINAYAIGPNSQVINTDIGLFNLAPGTYNINATANGYNPSSTQSVTMQSGDNTRIVYLYLDPTQHSNVTASIVINPQVDGTSWTLTGSTVTLTGTSINGAGIVTAPLNATLSVPDGTYTFTITAPGYTSYPQVVNITSSNSSITAQLVKSSDTTNSIGTTAVAGQPSSAIVQALLNNPLTPAAPSQAEWVPPTDAYNKYYTATQARIYVNRLFIDEVNGLQFVLQDNTIPVFGYASRYADAYGQGRSLIQGQFVINFISEAYLLTMLNDVGGFTGGNLSTPTPGIQSAVVQDNNIAKLIQQGDPNQMLSTLVSARTQTIAAAGPGAVPAIKAARKKASTPTNKYNNAVYQSQVFDMEIDFGEGPTKRVRRLEKIKLTSNEVILDQSGTPVLDTYGFIARRLL